MSLTYLNQKVLVLATGSDEFTAHTHNKYLGQRSTISKCINMQQTLLAS